jgi:hypothetical protein
MKITPVLAVPSIEKVLPLWEALGFQRTTEMPHAGALGFVILEKDGAEVMYQSYASIQADEPRVGTPGKAMLFVQVDDLEAIIAKLPADADRFVEKRTTPYGATETFLRDAAGNVIVFAQFG